MSIPNSPLLPGSKLEQAAKSKSTFSIAAFIFSAHVAVFLVVLLNGCNKESSATNAEPSAATNQTDLAIQPGTSVGDTNATALPIGLDTNIVATPPGGAVTFPPLANGTNAPVPPPNLGVTPPIGSPTGDPTTNEAAGAGSEYKIKSGDIAYNIAKTHGVSLKALKDANPNVDLGKLKPGQTIQIPAASASTSKAAATTIKADSSSEPAATGATTAYTVKGGDTLGKIAKKHGTTPKAIRAANGLSSDKINVGQKLKIPGKGTAAETTEPAAKALTVPEPAAPIPATLPAPGTGR
jgi:LysM repeat protein